MFPVDAFRSTLRKAVAILERHSIRFHLTGGITSVVYGEPRMTQDIDLVIDHHAIASQLELFLTSLETSDFMMDASAIRAAVAQHGMFQLLDGVESLKLDIYPRELIPGELERSEQVEIFEGESLPIVSRADAALSKLLWISQGSHKSRRDFRQIYRTASAAQQQLINAQASQFKLQTLLEEVLGEPDEIA
ncbi:MAG: nucleotidyl transferase AbiEii/AbiGii toxin family protein [Pirellulales bacterium]|nr:nucleotidyl transferase AbiEii/AbiGii toxin family protein [Pirellulales bacterium]